MEAFQLREDLAVTNAKLQAIEEIDPAESTAGTAFRPEDGMNAYLEKYMEKSHRTEEPITESVESSRDAGISQPDFVDLGAVPKTPLQRAMRGGLAQKSMAVPQTTTAATTRLNLSSGGTRTTLTQPRRAQSTPGREPFEPLDNSDLTNLLVSVVAQSALPKKEVPVFNGNPLESQLFMQAIKYNIEDKTDSDEDRLYFLEQYTVGQPK